MLLLLALCVVVSLGLAANVGVVFARETIAQPRTGSEGFAGSVSCRQCHERFYKLWSVSNHGLAMQPYTPEFSEQNLQSQKEAISIEGSHYRAEIGSGQGWVVESGEHGKKKYPG